MTNIEILNGPPDGTPELRPSTLAAFHMAHAQHARRDTKKKEAIEKAIKEDLTQFDPEELKEKEDEAKERNK